MDPKITATIADLTSSSSVLAELAAATADQSEKSQLEALKAQVDLRRTRLEAIAKDCDDLVRRREMLRAERKHLEERLTFLKLSRPATGRGN